MTFTEKGDDVRGKEFDEHQGVGKKLLVYPRIPSCTLKPFLLIAYSPVSQNAVREDEPVLGANHIVAHEGGHGVSSLPKYAVLCLRHVISIVGPNQGQLP
jgi:hypothetical protein